MSRKRPAPAATEDVFRRDLKALDKQLAKDLEDALDVFTKRVEQTLQRLHDRLRSPS